MTVSPPGSSWLEGAQEWNRWVINFKDLVVARSMTAAMRKQREEAACACIIELPKTCCVERCDGEAVLRMVLDVFALGETEPKPVPTTFVFCKAHQDHVTHASVPTDVWELICQSFTSAGKKEPDPALTKIRFESIPSSAGG